MPTGSGKTLIAIMLILRIFDMYDIKQDIRIKKLSYLDIIKKNENYN
jgi:hypothetical protein